MNPATLKFYVKEDGGDFSLSDMTEPESAAIGECVNDLLPATYGAKYWFEVDTCILDSDEDEPAYGLVCCFVHNPSPHNGSLLESRLPHPIPQSLIDALGGKTFRISPRQLGLSPWGTKVEVTFESLAPEPQPAPPVPPVPIPQPEPEPSPAPGPAPAHGPRVGIRASDLIAAALKAY